MNPPCDLRREILADFIEFFPSPFPPAFVMLSPAMLAVVLSCAIEVVGGMAIARDVAAVMARWGPIKVLLW